MADPYYNSVALLLHCDGVNGSTTFTDNSPTPKTVTPTGNAQVSTTQSKFGGASAYFDGSGDYLTLDGSSDFAFGTGDFTIEMWVYKTVAADCVFYCTGTTSFGGATALALYSSVTGTYQILIQDGLIQVVGDPGSIPLNTWTHIAATRSGTTVRGFVNGTQVGSNTDSTSLTVAANRPIIGYNGAATSLPFTGYLDEIRITKGVSRYTAAFTPPTAAFDNFVVLAADPYYNSVALLLHCDGVNGSTTFTDNSSSPKTITPTTTIISTTQSKFGLSSAYFNGSTSYLSSPNSAVFAMGSGDFTIEFFVNMSVVGSNYRRVFSYGSAALEGVVFEIDTANIMGAGFSSNGTIFYTVTDTVALVENTWYHFALVRSGNTLTLYKDGISLGNTSVTGVSVSDSGAHVITIGKHIFYTGRFFNGFLDELRVTKGIARYTANFTPPTVAFDTTIGPPTYSKLLNTTLKKSFLSWITLPNYYRYVPAALGKTLVNYSSSPKHYTTIYTYKARNDFNNAYFGGVGTVSGTVKIGTNVAKRRVRLYENSTGILVREMWTNTDGTYSFTGLKKDYIYTVTTTDIDNVYNDVIYSKITAV